MSERRILVTGANGFVGSKLLGYLHRMGRTVRAAVRDAERAQSLRGRAHDFVAIGDIGGNTDWTRALERVDAIVHLAGRAHVLSEQSPNPLAQFRAVNVEGTLRLAEQAAGSARRLVFVSSIGVNGPRTTGKPFSEASPPSPVEDYAVSKYEAEVRLHELSARTGLEVVVVRPPLVYGPNCPGNFLRLLRLVNSGVPLPLASVRNRRSFLYVENLASALLACAEDPRASGRTYLVDDGETISTAELARLLGDLLGSKTRLVACPVALLDAIGRLAGRSDAIRKLTESLAIDGSAIRRELGWWPQCTMKEGLAETARWYRSVEPHRSTFA